MMTDSPTREATFLTATQPSLRELDEIEREFRRVPKRRRAITCMHAEIVWRLRQGEPVSVERMLALWPFMPERLLTEYVEDLRSWGILSDHEPALQLAEVR